MNVIKKVSFLGLISLILMFSACSSSIDNKQESNKDIISEIKEDNEEIEEMDNKEKLVCNKEYFVNVNKDYTKDDIINEIGEPIGISGSGMCWYIWETEDKDKVSIWFKSNGKIGKINIKYASGGGECIY